MVHWLNALTTPPLQNTCHMKERLRWSLHYPLPFLPVYGFHMWPDNVMCCAKPKAYSRAGNQAIAVPSYGYCR